MNIQQYSRLLTRYLKPQGLRVALLTVLLLGGIGLQLVNPQLIRYFLDTAQTRGPQSALLVAAGLFIGFSIVQRALALWADYVAENTGWAATNAVRKDLTLHCLRLDMPFHKQHVPGELIERIDGDVTALANFFSQFVIRVLGNALLVAGILLLLFREDVLVGIGLTLYALATLLILLTMQRLAVPRWAALRQARAEHFGFLEERLSGAEDIRAVGAEPYVMRRLFLLMRNLLEKGRTAFVMGSLISNVTGLLFVIGNTVGLAVGVYLYTRGQATIGTAYLIVYYVNMLSAPLQNIREQALDLQQSTASIQRVSELFSLQPRVSDTGQVMIWPRSRPNRDKFSHPSLVSRHSPLPHGPLSVEFQNVSFRYEDDEPVLQDVTFHLQPGRVLGVLGRTGSGKTTLTRLLFRLYDPTDGLISLSDVDLRKAALSDLRARVGMVTQDVQLFQATIRNNLAFFNRAITDGQIEHALKNLGLWGWLQSLPDGLDTQLAAGGQGLSAGEAQLLAFTRVFLKAPGLVILDEASSRLDPATEALLERALDRLFYQRTAILIAHRLQTVMRADEILILENGRVVEYGPRAQLAAGPGSRFYSLLQTGLEETLA